MGPNTSGCLGIGDTQSSLIPRCIEPLTGKKIVDIAAGSGPHVLILTNEGEVYSWGHNSYMQLGNGGSAPGLSPSVLARNLRRKVVEIACGSHHSMVLTDEGEVYAWGYKNCGQFVIVDKCEKAMKLLDDEEISVKLIVLMDKISEDVRNKAAGRGIEIMSFAELEGLGKENPKEFVPPKPEGLHTICNTSGTTGNPKGAMLTHRAFIADASSLFAVGFKGFLNVTSENVHISYLPLAHAFEKIVQMLCYMQGASIGFFQGDIKLLMDDLQTLKPTLFPIVPRLMNRIYDKVNAGASQSFVKKFLLGQALKKKMALLKKGVVSRNTFWDKLVFKKIQNMLGGRVRIYVTGAAPVSPTVLNFMRCALGIPLTEGYGQTESTAGISITVPGDYEGGNVGTIIPGCFVKLVDVPEKDYFAKDGKGEVCAKEGSDTVDWFQTPEVSLSGSVHGKTEYELLRFYAHVLFQPYHTF